MNDYARVARVIRYLDQSRTEQPDLATLAAHIGLSPFHFHRLFTSWAAITPKDFLQCLTVAHAKTLLRNGSSVLDVALAEGLSGPGRLHDLCVNMEAASPGELKSGGAGWTISAGLADSPFGKCLIGEGPRGVCHLSFADTPAAEAQLAEIQASWPRARLHRDDGVARRLATRIFERGPARNTRPVLRAFVRGTAFQVRVWRALLEVRPGTVVSYGAVAGAVGMTGAARAVGNAVGQNPLAYLVPCHRVIRETGVVGNYHWGTIRKRAMLAWESARVANSWFPSTA